MGLTIERKKTTRRKKIPESFIYEILDGRPLYYKGYKQAIRNHLNAESIMGASTLQVINYRITTKNFVFSCQQGIQNFHRRTRFVY